MLEQMLSGEDCLRGRWVYKKKSRYCLHCLVFSLSSDRMHYWPRSRSFSQDRGQHLHQQLDVVPRCSVEAWGRKSRRSTQRRQTFRGDFLSPESRKHLLHWYQCSHSYCVWGTFVIRYVLHMQVFLLSELFFSSFYGGAQLWTPFNLIWLSDPGDPCREWVSEYMCWTCLERGRNRARCARLMWPFILLLLLKLQLSQSSSTFPPPTDRSSIHSLILPSIYPSAQPADWCTGGNETVKMESHCPALRSH